MEMPTGISSTLEMITPQEAKGFLVKMAHQRPIKPSKVKLFTELMNQGKWGISEASICFDVNGNLINGQHRMRALVEHGKPQPFNVMRGMATDSFFIMDQGTKRSGSDTLASLGFTDPDACAPIGRNLMSLSIDGRFGRNFTSQRDLADFCEPRCEYIEEAAELAKRSKNVFAASHIGTLLYQALKVDEPKAREFAERFLTGVAPTADDPILRVRNKLIKMKGEDKNQRPESTMPLLVSAWDAFFEGRLVVKLAPAQRPFIKGMSQSKI